MRWIDRGLSVLLILGGVGHTFGVLNFYKDPHTLFWALTDSVLVFLLAAINLLRTWQVGNRPLAILTSCASAAYVVIALGFGRLIGDMTDFRVILFGVIALGLTGFSLRDALARFAIAKRTRQMWIGFPVTAIAASFSASECVGWAWQV